MCVVYASHQYAVFQPYPEISANVDLSIQFLTGSSRPYVRLVCRFSFDVRSPDRFYQISDDQRKKPMNPFEYNIMANTRSL